MSRILVLVVSLVLYSSMNAFAGTIYFTGSEDARPLVEAPAHPQVKITGGLSLNAGNFLTSGTGKTTNLVTEFAEVNATTLARMGTLTVILTEPSISGWMFTHLYTASGGEIQVGIGDNLEDGTISAYITTDADQNFEVPDSDNAVGFRLSSDGSSWSIETTQDYGTTWIAGLSWDMSSLPAGLTGDRVLDVLRIGSYGATAGYCQFSWESVDFADLNAPNPSCAAKDEGEDKADDDIIIADFESATYGDWTVEGKAFGRAPAKGTLPGQRTVAGYLGAGLANSSAGGEDGLGKLTSPTFTLERSYLNVLIGGGYSPGASLTLSVFKDNDWHTLKTVHGNSYATWKTQAMKWESWDVSGSQGLDARIEIVDDVTGAEGFIVIDHVVQSHEDFSVPLRNHVRELEIGQNYLHFPVKNDEPPRLVKLQQNGQSVREFEIQFATGEPDFWVYLETHEFRGEKLTLIADQRRYEPANLLQAVSTGPEPRNFDTFYKEALRPQFHYSSPRGWSNDPNGMVYYDGEYHLFYQRNPFGWDWGNMTWGHAISTDMVHWTNLPDTLHPDASGTMFSGTAVIDKDNTAGFKTGDEDPIILFYTSAGGTNPWSEGVPHTQSIAYSNDRGRTFTKYTGNPIVEYIRKGNRDPKVFWHEPTQQWSMVLYLGDDELAFFTSSNLKDWTEHKESRIKGFHECPELFELPVDGDPNNMKWVLYGALGDYYIGDFDGKAFTPETKLIKFRHARNFYASQTFNDIPKQDGRRIQIGWARYTDLPGMPFNQMMNFPVTLSLKTTKDGIRMHPMPIREIETLYKSETTFEEKSIQPGDNLLSGFQGDLFDIEADIELAGADRVGLRIGGLEIAYDTKEKKLTSNLGRADVPNDKTGKEKPPEGVSAKLEPGDGRIQLRILVDRNFIEVYANSGEVFIPIETVSEGGQDKHLALFAEGGTARIRSLAIRELESIWE